MDKQESLGKRLRTLMEERQLNYEALGRLLEMIKVLANRCHSIVDVIMAEEDAAESAKS